MSRKLKILMIGPKSVNPGGITEFFNNLNQFNNEENFKLEYIGVCTSGNSSFIGKILELLVAILMFFLKIIIFRPDIVHINTSSNASFYRKYIFVVLAKILRKRVVLHIHSGAFLTFYEETSLNVQKLIRHALNISDMVLVLTDFWRAEFKKTIKFDTPICILSNFIDILKYRNNGEKYIKNQKRVLFLGKISTKKGVYDILESISSVSKKYPNIEFVFAGNGHPEEIKQFTNKIKHMGVSENVNYLGWINFNIKKKYLHESDILVLPSYQEAFGIVLIEAMAVGLPIIASNIGGIPDVVKDRENALLIEPGDVSSLKESILEIFDDDILSNKLKSNNLDKSKKYDVRKVIADLSAYYNEVI
ncbi:hypothetical protein COL41_04180 [Bacillus mycoides]|uniref:glycosyltransferase family 4 protein n=1 Tax=Bacillus mycoides TaxID=1405 RepID=UPI000BF422EF|nr:glycosyltransferase family 4 protein [Bacillus mycoides]PFX98197.1 hypothetical protein COL41_04180 [Bacillus mycoides]QWH03513.1 glycosyltransferase family 1 protein [Bacillus mycoides]